MPGGQLVIHHDGIGFKQDSGEPFVIATNGRCDTCCPCEDGCGCEIWFCGCGMPFADSWMLDQEYSYPVRMRLPEMLESSGFCSREHFEGHATILNTGDEMLDAITTHKLVCNGNGTATMTVQNIVYIGNSPSPAQPKTKWRLKGFGGDASGGGRPATGSGRDAWPLLDCMPSYDPATGKLNVTVKWADILANDDYTLEVRIGHDDGSVTMSMDSYTGAGSAAFDNSTKIATVTEAGEGVASDSFVFSVSDLPDECDRIEVVFSDADRPGSPFIWARLIKDYYHEVAGADSATITYDPTSSDRCGFCSDTDVEIDFTTAVSAWTVALLARRGEQNVLHHFEENWCGCGSEPYAEGVSDVYETKSSELFWYTNAESFGTGKWHVAEQLPQWNSEIWPIERHPIGKQYGWNLADNNIYRNLTTGYDHNDQPLEIPYSTPEESGKTGYPQLPLVGEQCLPRLTHLAEAGLDEPYNPTPLPQDSTYRDHSLYRLGSYRPLAHALQSDEFPTHRTTWIGQERRVEWSLKMRMRYFGDFYWAASSRGQGQLNSWTPRMGSMGCGGRDPREQTWDERADPFWIGYRWRHHGGVRFRLGVPVNIDFIGSDTQMPPSKFFDFRCTMWAAYTRRWDLETGDGYFGAPVVNVSGGAKTSARAGYGGIFCEVAGADEWISVKAVAKAKFLSTGIVVDYSLFVNDELLDQATPIWTQGEDNPFSLFSCYGSSMDFYDRPYRFKGDIKRFDIYGTWQPGVPFIERNTVEFKDMKIQHFNTYG